MRKFLTVLILFLLTGYAFSAQGEAPAFFPFYWQGQVQKTADKGPVQRSDCLWPLFAQESTSQTHRLRFSPLFSREAVSTESLKVDVLWPLAHYRKTAQTRARHESLMILPLWFSRSGEIEGRQDFWRLLFPLYYEAEKKAPDIHLHQSYLIFFPLWWQFNQHRLFFPVYWNETGDSFMFWPFYGRLQQFLDIDKIAFTLWPLWMTTQEGEWKSWNVLWPFFGYMQHEKEGAGFRLWPLISMRRTPEGPNRYSWLWPLGNALRFQEGPFKGSELTTFLPFWFDWKHPQGRRIWSFFPFYGESRSNQRLSRTWLWPLFSTTRSYQPAYFKWQFLYFLLSRQKGPDQQRRFYFLNLLGWTVVPDKYKRVICLWPIAQYRYDHLLEDRPEWKRLYILPFWYGSEKVHPSGEKETRRVLWPLATWGSEEEGDYFSCLSLLPCRPGDGIGRNWAPLWTLFHWEKSSSGSRQLRLLGPFWQQQTVPEKEIREWSLLNFHYRSEEGSHAFSLFGGYWPFRWGEPRDGGKP